ncbi:hypothetical protein G9A89_003667 [Geosiphon pyriformis]|nr:hypothetical protein G9A89_003667 [Geosiphon pyriformis]
MGRINIPVNMAEKEIVNQGEIISMSQAISIPPYGQYMVRIKQEIKEQNQIFEAEPILCELREIGLINLYIPAKNYNHIKIPIYNNTRNVIVIPAGTTIRYLSTEIEYQPPSTIPDFPQLCGYVDITSQTIYEQSKYYKKLNGVIRGDSYPIPQIQELFDAFADKEKTAFTTRKENFEFEVMSFGLTNTPATFQWLIEIVYTGLL